MQPAMKHPTFLAYLTLITLLMTAAGCSDPQRNIAGNYTFKTECMGVELDGSVTVKAWGNGRYRFTDAVDQAKKNAIRDVLFSGITEGRQDCNPRPVLGEVNAQLQHEEYFNRFFADRGEYREFVNAKDERLERRIHREKKKARESVTFGVILRVKRQELIDKMKHDRILK